MYQIKKGALKDAQEVIKGLEKIIDGINIIIPVAVKYWIYVRIFIIDIWPIIRLILLNLFALIQIAP